MAPAAPARPGRGPVISVALIVFGPCHRHDAPLLRPRLRGGGGSGGSGVQRGGGRGAGRGQGAADGDCGGHLVNLPLGGLQHLGAEPGRAAEPHDAAPDRSILAACPLASMSWCPVSHLVALGLQKPWPTSHAAPCLQCACGLVLGLVPDTSVVDGAKELMQMMPSQEVVPNRWFMAARNTTSMICGQVN